MATQGLRLRLLLALLAAAAATQSVQVLGAAGDDDQLFDPYFVEADPTDPLTIVGVEGYTRRAAYEELQYVFNNVEQTVSWAFHRNNMFGSNHHGFGAMEYEADRVESYVEPRHNQSRYIYRISSHLFRTYYDVLKAWRVGYQNRSAVPAGWQCEASEYNSSDGCSCGCGGDPDCSNPRAHLQACMVPGSGRVSTVGQQCNMNTDSCEPVAEGAPAAAEWTCRAELYNASDSVCDCGCGTLTDPDCTEEYAYLNCHGAGYDGSLPRVGEFCDAATNQCAASGGVDCARLNRAECASPPCTETCGECLDGYAGEAGSGTGLCHFGRRVQYAYTYYLRGRKRGYRHDARAGDVPLAKNWTRWDMGLHTFVDVDKRGRSLKNNAAPEPLSKMGYRPSPLLGTDPNTQKSVHFDSLIPNNGVWGTKVGTIQRGNMVDYANRTAPKARYAGTMHVGNDNERLLVWNRHGHTWFGDVDGDGRIDHCVGSEVFLNTGSNAAPQWQLVQTPFLLGPDQLGDQSYRIRTNATTPAFDPGHPWREAHNMRTGDRPGQVTMEQQPRITIKEVGWVDALGNGRRDLLMRNHSGLGSPYARIADDMGSLKVMLWRNNLFGQANSSNPDKFVLARPGYAPYDQLVAGPVGQRLLAIDDKVQIVFEDFDGDSRVDCLLVTLSNGPFELCMDDGVGDVCRADFKLRLHYFRNVGTPSEPNFQELTGSLNPFAALEGGPYGYLVAHDLDGDGDKDILVRGKMAAWHYWENIAAGGGQPRYWRYRDDQHPLSACPDTDAVPFSYEPFAFWPGTRDMWIQKESTHGLLKYAGTPQREDRWSFVRGPENPFEALPVRDEARKQDIDWNSMVMTDLDGDGLVDMLRCETGPHWRRVLHGHYEGLDRNEVGGRVVFLRNTGSALRPQYSEVAAGSAEDPFRNVPISSFFCRLYAGDVDGDGDTDLALLEGKDDTLSLLRNGGTRFAPSFTRVSDNAIQHPFRDVVFKFPTGERDKYYLWPRGYFRDTFFHNPVVFGFFDYDGDGDQDLVTGVHLDDSITIDRMRENRTDDYWKNLPGFGGATHKDYVVPYHNPAVRDWSARHWQHWYNWGQAKWLGGDPKPGKTVSWQTGAFGEARFDFTFQNYMRTTLTAYDVVNGVSVPRSVPGPYSESDNRTIALLRNDRPQYDLPNETTVDTPSTWHTNLRTLVMDVYRNDNAGGGNRLFSRLADAANPFFVNTPRDGHLNQDDPTFGPWTEEELEELNGDEFAGQYWSLSKTIGYPILANHSRPILGIYLGPFRPAVTHFYFSDVDRDGDEDLVLLVQSRKATLKGQYASRFIVIEKRARVVENYNNDYDYFSAPSQHVPMDWQSSPYQERHSFNQNALAHLHFGWSRDPQPQFQLFWKHNLDRVQRFPLFRVLDADNMWRATDRTISGLGVADVHGDGDLDLVLFYEYAFDKEGLWENFGHSEFDFVGQIMKRRAYHPVSLPDPVREHRGRVAEFLFLHNTGRDCAAGCLNAGVCLDDPLHVRDGANLTQTLIRARSQAVQADAGTGADARNAAVRGTCFCAPRFTGAACESCAAAFFGMDCEHRCPLGSSVADAAAYKYPFLPVDADACACKPTFVRRDAPAGSRAAFECTCPPGTTLDTELDACVTCPEGYYKAEAGLGVCAPCTDVRPGSSTVGRGASSAADCQCEGATFLDVASDVCLECPPGVVLETGNVCRCPASFFLETTANGTGLSCRVCGDGVDCSEPGSVSGRLAVKRGFWRVRPDADNIWPCPYPAFCDSSASDGASGGAGGAGRRALQTVGSGNDGAETEPRALCALHHEGPFCLSCERGYAMSVDDARYAGCVECDGAQSSTDVIVGTVLVVYAGFVALVLPSLLLWAPAAYGPCRERSVRGGVAGVSRAARLRLVLGLAQLLAIACVLRAERSLVADALASLLVGDVTVLLPLAGAGCELRMDWYARSLAYLCVPFIAAATCAGGLWLLRRDRAGFALAARRVSHAFFLSTVLVYPGVALRFVLALLPLPLPASGADTDPFQVLRADRSIDFAGAVGWRAGVALLALPLLVGAPAALAVVVRARLRVIEAARKNPRVLLFSAVASDPYRAGYEHLEAFACAFKFAAVAALAAGDMAAGGGQSGPRAMAGVAVLALVLLLNERPYRMRYDNLFAQGLLLLLVMFALALAEPGTSEAYVAVWAGAVFGLALLWLALVTYRERAAGRAGDDPLEDGRPVRHRGSKGRFSPRLPSGLPPDYEPARMPEGNPFADASAFADIADDAGVAGAGVASAGAMGRAASGRVGIKSLGAKSRGGGGGSSRRELRKDGSGLFAPRPPSGLPPDFSMASDGDGDGDESDNSIRNMV